MITPNAAWRTISRFSLLALVLVSAFFLSACNTVAGMGADVEAAGEAIEDKAEKEKRY